MNYLTFTKDEYTLVADGIRIAIKTILGKLPGAKRREADARLEAANMRQRLEAAGVEAGLLNEFLDLNACQKPTKIHSAPALRRMMTDLVALLELYGVGPLSLALLKVVGLDAPQKATVPYVRAILKNAQAGSLDLPADPPVHPDNIVELWTRTKRRLQQRMSVQQWVTWIEPITLQGMHNGLLLLVCPDETYRYQLKTTYAWVMKESWQQAGGLPLRGIRFLLPAQQEEEKG